MDFDDDTLRGLTTAQLRQYAAICRRRAASVQGDKRKKWMELEAKFSDLADTIERNLGGGNIGP